MRKCADGCDERSDKEEDKGVRKKQTHYACSNNTVLIVRLYQVLTQIQRQKMEM